MRQGIRHEAEELLREILDIDPENEIAKRELGRFYKAKPDPSTSSAGMGKSSPLRFTKKGEPGTAKDRTATQKRESKVFRGLIGRRPDLEEEEQAASFPDEEAQRSVVSESGELPGQSVEKAAEEKLPDRQESLDFELDIDNLIAESDLSEKDARLEKTDTSRGDHRGDLTAAFRNGLETNTQLPPCRLHQPNDTTAAPANKIKEETMWDYKFIDTLLEE